jgi:tetratricopeptide (TPR) repeat protein
MAGKVMFKIFKIIVYIGIVPSLIIGSILIIEWMETRDEARENRLEAVEKLTDQATNDHTLDPGDTHAYYNRGKTYYKKGQYDQAIKEYTKTIELNPTLAEAYDDRGLTYFDKLGDKKRGCTDWKLACDLGVCENYNLAKRNGDCK